jgi:hypothetical protein
MLGIVLWVAVGWGKWVTGERAYPSTIYHLLNQIL